MIINICQHDKAGDPKIMWDLVFFLETLSMVGVQFGALINDLLPEWFLQIASMLFYFFNFVQMTKKSINGIKRDRELLKGKSQITEEDLLKAEKEQIQKYHSKKQEMSPDIQNNDQQDNQQQNSPDTLEQQNQPLLEENQQAYNQPEAEIKYKKCGHMIRVNQLRLWNLIGIMIITTALAIWRSQVDQCGTMYWVIISLSIVFGLVSVVINDVSLQKSIKKHDRYIYFGQVTNTMLDTKKRLVHSLIAFVAGIVASTLGIGGSIIMTPLMLSMGIPSSVVRYAASTMVSLTSFTSMIQYVTLGLIDYNETWIYMVCVAIFYPVGFFLAKPLMKICKSTSVIQLVMAIAMLISSIFVAITAINSIIDMVNTGVVEGFHDICQVN